MSKLDERTLAKVDLVLEQVCKVKMDLVLEQVCKVLSAYGGDHESRKYIALKMIEAAGKGNTALGDLEVVARRALNELTQRKSA